MRKDRPTLLHSEARACILLCILLGAGAVLKSVISRWFNSRNMPGHIATIMCAEQEQLAQVEHSRSRKAFIGTSAVHPLKRSQPTTSEPGRPAEREYDRPRRPRPIACSLFDPNTVPSDTLRSWGVRAFVVDNLVKYRESGGSIHDAKDLGKIYGMDSMTLQDLSACVRIIHIDTRPSTPVIIDLNTASSEELRQLKGIGPVFAERIIKFREALGGFSNIEQVSETYGLPPETYEHIKSALRLTAGHKTIPVNRAPEQKLASHPYISYRDAKAIIAYIANHGDLRGPEDLLSIHSLDRAWVDRVAPYLDFTAVGADRTTR